MFNHRKLKLKRWQKWLLLLVGFWLLISGIMQLQRERDPFSVRHESESSLVYLQEAEENGQYF